MSSTFEGFSDEDLKRLKSLETGTNSEPKLPPNVRKIDKLGAKPKRMPQYKTPLPKSSNSDNETDNITFEKCKLSIKSTGSSEDDIVNNNNNFNKELSLNNYEISFSKSTESITLDLNEDTISDMSIIPRQESTENVFDNRKSSTDITPDIVRGVENYTEDELVIHKQKLEELQLKQKIMEEQNKKRKEMLAKALADRTKQTEEEVQKLEKIKKELNVLDGQLSQDVAVLRKKIDQACLTFADAEKHYLKIEKEFLQAKIHLQKAKEKKELLTEHLCALITHNETRKAQKLETLMHELAYDGKIDDHFDDDDDAVVVDGVDQKTGKMVELNI